MRSYSTSLLKAIPMKEINAGLLGTITSLLAISF
jgi:hypothetical protein